MTPYENVSIVFISRQRINKMLKRIVITLNQMENSLKNWSKHPVLILGEIRYIQFIRSAYWY